MRRSKASRGSVFAGAALVALLCTPGAALGGGSECAVDADCVPAGCCHATKCVPTGEAPKCADVACTMDCRPGTLDCGGRCVCSEGTCEAKLGDDPAQ
jgi:hypothetical protein